MTPSKETQMPFLEYISSIFSRKPMLLLIVTVLFATTIVISSQEANALTQRDFSYLNDNPITVLSGNTKICGNHMCSPGEWSELQSSLSTSQRGQQATNNVTSGATTQSISFGKNITQNMNANQSNSVLIKPAIILVHGGFVDGSGWESVYQILKNDGYNVSIVQNPTISLTGDVATTQAVIDAQNKSVILVGHSYGGAVITEAGNDPKVVGLVYVTAFAPDAGESVASLIATFPPGGPMPPILPPQNGFLSLDKQKFAASFAADLPPQKAAFMADSQVPWGIDALNGNITKAAWKDKPAWYLVATDDKMIPPDAQRQMAKHIGATVVEVAGSHAIYMSQPKAVAEFIEKAATGSR